MQVVMIRVLRESAVQARTQQEELKSSFVKRNKELAEYVEARAELEIHKEAAKESCSDWGGEEEKEAEVGEINFKLGLLIALLIGILSHIFVQL